MDCSNVAVSSGISNVDCSNVAVSSGISECGLLECGCFVRNIGVGIAQVWLFPKEYRCGDCSSVAVS